MNENDPILGADSPRQIALAYEWFLTPFGFADYDLALGFGVYDSRESKPWNTCFHARIPAKQLVGPQSDVSGNLGIIFPVSDKETKARASASERLIADAIIWQLAALRFDSHPTLILLQGPFLPKLRGRLLYRGTAASVSIWSLTHQPQWFRRMEAAEQIAKRVDPRTKVSPIYPPKGLDSSTRCWVCTPSPKTLWHLEVLANGWDCCLSNDWEASRQKEIDLLVSELSGSPSDSEQLPKSLQSAREQAIEACEIEREFAAFLPQLRQINHDPKRAKENTLVSVYSNVLVDRQLPSDELVLVQHSGELDMRKEQAVYKRFKERYSAIKKAKPQILTE